jgi:hypothetical protein
MADTLKQLTTIKTKFIQLLGIRSDISRNIGLRVTNKAIEINKFASRFCNIHYKPNHYRIEIDITYACNLRCYNCNRSCTQAPTTEYMTVGQIEKFTKESRERGRKWEKIRIMGGEPTLHPHLFGILQALLNYKNDFSPQTRLILISNGFGPKVNRILSQIPKAIEIENTRKISMAQKFDSFNIAPIDLSKYEYADFSRGCFLTFFCGIGLNRYGYYPCAVGGGIDRVFGFGIGRKKIPASNDLMRDQLQVLCKYCGHFKWDNTKLNAEEMSSSWKRIYEKVKKEKSAMSPY